MSVIDIGIVILLLFGAIIGAKRGFTKALVKSLGFILAVVIAFKLKNVVSEILYLNAPFFKFGGIFKGLTVLNIVLYELIAFVIILSILMIVLKILVMVTGIFEKFLNMTIILGIPSKILGAIIGFIEHYVIIFIVLYVISLPIFDNEFLNQSKYKDKILTQTPILSKQVDKTVVVFEEFSELKDKYKNSKNATEFNLETLDLFLKHKIITVDSVKKLRDKDKLQIGNIDIIINKYERG